MKRRLAFPLPAILAAHKENLMSRPALSLACAAFLAACATIEGPGSSNLSAYCTPQNAFRLGSQSKAYFGGCPKETEAAFLAGLERGRTLRPAPPQVWPYYERMRQLEKQLVAANSEAERNTLRERLREAEWWAVHIINAPGTYSNFN
jgi:hypothetical protein